MLPTLAGEANRSRQGGAHAQRYLHQVVYAHMKPTRLHLPALPTADPTGFTLALALDDERLPA